MKPLVSVIIPTFNRRDWLLEAIDSVWAQTYTDFEVLVIDDGSTDGTGAVLKARYGARIRYLWQENQGESAARNEGIRVSKGKYLALLDSDDLWLPDKLTRQVVVLESDPMLGLVFCQATPIGKEGERLPGANIGTEQITGEICFERLCLKNLVGAASTVIVRSEVLELTGLFDESIHYGEDWDLWLRLSLVGRIQRLPEVLAQIRLHQGGQWWFPGPKKVARVLEDHLYLLERAFEQWPDKTKKACTLRDKARAKEYAKAAWAYYAFEQTEKARKCLETALTLDPQTWQSLTELKRGITGTALVLSQMQPDNCRVAERYVTAVLEHLPNALSVLHSERRNLMAHVEVEIGYYHHILGDRKRARAHLWRGIKFAPHYLSNIGLLKILLGAE